MDMFGSVWILLLLCLVRRTSTPSTFKFLVRTEGQTDELEVALEREVEGDLFLQDIGQGFGFRPGSFDGAISYVDPSSYIPNLSHTP